MQKATSSPDLGTINGHTHSATTHGVKRGGGTPQAMLSPASVLERNSRTLPLGKHGEGTPQMTHDPFGNVGGVHGQMLSYMTWAHQEQAKGPPPPGNVTAPVPMPPPMSIRQAHMRGSLSGAAPEGNGSYNAGPKFRYAGGTGK